MAQTKKFVLSSVRACNRQRQKDIFQSKVRREDTARQEIYNSKYRSNSVTTSIRIGISKCLLGHNVRFDGGNKHDRYMTEILGPYFEWVPVCPEVEAGLGVPRPTLRLETINEEVRLIQAGTGVDLTNVIKSFSEKRVRELKNLNLSGYLLKSKSPSCAKGGLRIYAGSGIRPTANGVGIFARELSTAFPNLPIEDEDRLTDPGLRHKWLTRVYAYHRFRNEILARPSLGKLVAFHSKHKFMILAHCPRTYKSMGVLVGTGKDSPLSELVIQYESLLMVALKKNTTIAKHINVLQHIFGFFKKRLGPEIRQDLLKTIEGYQRGELPLNVPIALIRHYVHLCGMTYLQDQIYLNPDPKELI